ncbi:MAG: carbohydrate-binding domain-containing protein [Planctomycetia bacterium]|nr:carbohydrate-binding domain-containing protein [Planctomycetia bacterium]
MKKTLLSLFLLIFPVSALFAQIPSPDVLGTCWEIFTSPEIRDWDQLNSAKNIKWEPVLLPEYTNINSKNPILWYRTQLEIRALKGNEHAFLCFGGIKFDAQIWIGGQKAGGYTGGGEPFELDITSAVEKGGKFPLLVRVEGAQAIAKEKPVAPQKGMRDAERFKGSVLWPVGSQGFSHGGIVEPVRLEIRDTVAVDDLFIQTSTEEKTIQVDLSLKNLAQTDQKLFLDMEVVPFKGEKSVFQFPRQTIALSKTGSVSVKKNWSNPRLWSIRDPYLYNLVYTVRDENGRVLIDRAKERFGFRQFQVQGDFLYLNGVPMHALGTASHPRTPIVDGDSRIPARDLYRKLRELNINFMRLHANLWPSGWVETADETGMPLILETGFFCWVGPYALKDPVFWKNYDVHVQALQKKFRNHPSFCMFSLCNEILHCGGARILPDIESKLAEAGIKAKKYDSTRPILFDGDIDPKRNPDDPAGVADLINPHYPMDYAGRLKEDGDTNWPDDAWWIDSGKILACYPNTFWKWDRKKPLYFGEFLHIQHFTEGDKYSLSLGDRASQVDFTTAMGESKGKTWSIQIPAYRAAGVSGLCPWVITEPGPEPVVRGQKNPRYQAVLDSYEPVSFAMRPTNRFFYFDQKKDLDFWLLNDTDVARELILSVVFSSEGRPFLKKTLPARILNPAKSEKITVSLDPSEIPGSAKKIDVKIQLDHRAVHDARIDWSKSGGLLEPGKDRFFQRSGSVIRSFSLICDHKESGKRSMKNWCGQVGFAGIPSQAASRLFKEMGITEIKKIDRIERTALDGIDLLVVGKNQLSRLFPDKQDFSVQTGSRPEENFAQFLKRGGKALIFEQETYPRSLFPVQLAPLNLGHYDHDQWTKRWSCFHPFSITPRSGRFEVYSRLGGPNGYQYAGILRTDHLVLCQLPFESEGSVNPAVYNDFWQCLSEFPDRKPVRLSVFDPSGKIQNTLQSIDAVYSGKAENADLYLINADSDPIQSMPNGAKIILCGLNPDNLKKWSSLFPKGLVLASAEGEVFRTAELKDQKGLQLFSGPQNDLLWFGSRKGLNYGMMSPIQNIADWQIVPFRMDESRIEELPSMKFDTFAASNQRTRMKPDHLWSGIAVVLSRKLDVPKGQYYLEIDAHGSSLNGEGSKLRISIDDQAMGITELKDEYSKTYVPMEIKNTPCELKIAYINDEWDPETRKDRNLWFRSARLVPAKEISPDFKTVFFPPVSVKITNDLMIDNIKWSSPEFPAIRAKLYLADLLRTNGVPFNPISAGLIIDGAQFDHPEKYKGVYNEPNVLSFGSNGLISKKVQFGEPGKYRFILTASGTAAEKIYPHFTFLVDGVKKGEFQLTSAERASYSVKIDLAKGEHELTLKFDNDLYIPSNDPNIPNQDRNSAIESLRIIKN